MPSESELRELYPRAPQPNIDAFVQNGDEILERFGISATPNRLQFFLAQIGHESGGLTITAENLNYRAERICEVWPSRFADADSARPFEHNPEGLANNVYSNRMGNGPPESGDGWRYRGRGYIQITGRDDYDAVGTVAGLDLIDNPDLANAPDNALLVACSFWQWKSLNNLCDSGDFVAVTRRINGGTIGIEDRRAWLEKVRGVLAMSPPAPDDQPSAEVVIAVQKALRANGYVEVGAADGLIGRHTVSAIARFRQENGLPPGLIDNELENRLGLTA